MSLTEYLVELVAYDASVPGTVTLRYSVYGHVTGPGETPANTVYDARIKQPAVMSRDLFRVDKTAGASRSSLGDLVLTNSDGTLDALLTYGVDGRAITVRRGPKGAAYPSGFPTVLVATMDRIEATSDTLTIKLRDRQREVQVPLQETKYAGDNALPAGLEGVADDLKGKPKPVCLGKVTNVPAVLVNTAKLIYQVNDGAIASLDGLYDRGVLLGNAFDTWGLVDLPADIIRAMAFLTDESGNALLYAVGDAGTIAFTEDGTAWGNRSPNDWSTTDIYAIGAGTKTVVGEAVAVAGGASGTMYIYGTADLSSGEGTSVTSQFSTNAIRAVHYWPQQHLWIAVGDGGKISTSADGGQTWTARTSGVATALYAIATSQNLIVVVGASGVVLTSPDGATWTSRTSGFSTSDIHGAVYGGGRFVIVGVTSKVGWSENGTLWTLETGVVPTHRAVTWADGVYVAVGDDQDVGTSIDGALWVPRTEGPSTTDYFTVAQVGTGAICAGGQETTIGAGGIFRGTVAGTYSSEADLLDEDLAPLPGTYKTYLAGGYFRLGAPPAGLITADVTQGSAASDRTAGQLFTDVLLRAGLTSGDWTAGDITALDSANNAVCGFWTDEETTCEEVLNLFAESVGAWWGVDAAGSFRIEQFTAPSGSAVTTFVADDLLRFRRLPSALPSYRTIVRWGQVYAVQDSDLAGGALPARRALVAKAWREAVKLDATVQTKHLLAVQTVEDSLLTTESDAQDEADRRQTLRGTDRDLYAVTVDLNAVNAALDLGDVVTVTHARYGLTAGKDFRCLRVEPDAASQRLHLTIWG